jgi:YHS domain-containing protein
MKKIKSKKIRNSGLKILAFLAIAFFTSSCMTMGIGHLSTNQNRNQNHPNEINYVDPVCGNLMEQVSEDLAYQYEGSTYYFHTSDCLNEFKQAPEKYITANRYQENHRNNNGMMWGLGAAAMIGMMFLMIL